MTFRSRNDSIMSTLKLKGYDAFSFNQRLKDYLGGEGHNQFDLTTRLAKAGGKVALDELALPHIQIVSYPNDVNYMPSPFDPEGWYGETNDPDGTITNVILANSSGQSYMGLAERTGAGGFNLTGFPTVSTVIGDNLSGAILIRKSNSLGSAFRFRIADSSGFLGDITVASEDGSYVAGGLAYQVTSTGSDILLEFKYTTVRDSGTGVYCQAFIWKDDNTGEPPIGSQLYVQAAFFGKADDWPALVSAVPE